MLLAYATTIVIPSYGNLTGSTAQLKVNGLDYTKVDEGSLNLGGFIKNDLLKSIKDKAVSDEEKSNYTQNTDPFFYWEMTEDKEFEVKARDTTIKVKTDDGGLFNSYYSVDNVAIGPVQVSYDKKTENSYIYSSEGIGIITDVDDVLRKVEIWNLESLAYYSFIKTAELLPYSQQLFEKWQLLPNISFHYSTEAPVVLAQSYMDLIKYNYPMGSLDMRPTNIAELPEILTARKTILKKSSKLSQIANSFLLVTLV